MSPTVIETVLAGFNVDRNLRDAITGDLIEERAELAAVHGERSADRWVRQQVLRSIPMFAVGAIRAGGLRLVASILGAASVALLTVSVLIGASSALLSALISPEAIGRITIVLFATELAYGAAGGYLAARFGRAAPLGAAFVLGILGVLAIEILKGDAHGWYTLGLQLLLIPATVCGGWLRARRLVR